MAKLSRDKYVQKVKFVHNNKYDYSYITNEWWEINYTRSRLTLLRDIVCPIHGKFNQNAEYHLHGKHGCQKCAIEERNNLKRISKDNFIKRSTKLHNKYDYSEVDFSNYKDSQTSIVTILCPNHGKFTQSVFNHLQGRGCPRCTESRGERKILNYLEENNISYEREYKFEELGKKRFDFYLENLNICIEFDGEQHFRPVDFFGGIETFNEIVKNDSIKNQYCINKNIQLIRISYLNIGNILRNKL